MIFYHIMMQKYGSQVFRDLKLHRLPAEYFVWLLLGRLSDNKMSFVWNSYRRLALLRHLAGVFPNVYKRSRCVKMSPRTEFPFNENSAASPCQRCDPTKTRHFSETISWSPQKRESVESNFSRHWQEKKHFFVDSPFVLWGMTDWFIT